MYLSLWKKLGLNIDLPCDLLEFKNLIIVMIVTNIMHT